MTVEICNKLGIHESWHEFFIDMSDVLQDIVNTIDSGPAYFPKKADIFKAFRMPKNKIRVVIVGQDPYPNGLATGIAFAVPKGKKSPSLEIIKDELLNYTHNLYIDSEFDETLEKWEDEGVFLINYALTLEQYKIASHYHVWRVFMDNLMQYMNDTLSGIIFVYFGNVAKRLSHVIVKTLHYKLFVPHPNADYHSKVSKFVGSDIFQKIDDILYKNHKEKIQWV